MVLENPKALDAAVAVRIVYWDIPLAHHQTCMTTSIARRIEFPHHV